MNKAEVIINIQHETQLLESLSWDESALSRLLEYLHAEFENFDLKHPTEIINEVEKNFGKATAEVLEELFEDQLKFVKAHSGGVHYDH